MNPFSQIGTANVGKARKAANGRGSGKRSFIESKPRPSTDFSASPRCMAPIRNDGNPKRPKLAPRRSPTGQALESGAQVIDLSFEGDSAAEVLGEPVAGPSRPPPPSSYRNKPRLNVPDDGPDTKKLESNYLDEDPIEMSTSPKSEEPARPKGLKVGKLVEKFESKNASKNTIPMHREDLSIRVKKQKPISVFPSVPSSLQGKKRKREEPQFLPLARFATDSTSGYTIVERGFISWEGPRLHIYNGQKEQPFSVEPQGYHTALLTTKSELGKALLSLREPKIERAAGIHELCILFDCHHDEWSRDTYEALRTALPFNSNPGPSLIDGIWDHIVHEARRREETKSKSLSAAIAKGKSRESETLSESSKTDVSTTKADATSASNRVPPTKHPGSKPGSRPLLGNVNPEKGRTRSNGEGSAPKAVPNTAIPISVPRNEPRRSTRHTVAPPEPVEDEVILVYPPGGTGAGKVTISTSDLARLEPGEFLNDTLIEFGLKLWLKGLEDTNPELAKQVHVFSSFFYKKLNQKDTQAGYNSVRKWTSKFDLFEKKYVVVPINENMHWYLAIIFEPAHLLSPPPSPPSQPPADEEPQASENPQDDPMIIEDDTDGAPEVIQATTSEERIEEDLTKNMSQRLSIISDGDVPDPKEIDVMIVDTPPPEPITIDDDAPTVGERPSTRQTSEEVVPETPPQAPVKVDEDNESDDLNLVEPNADVEVVKPETGIPADAFYGPSTSTRSGKQYEKKRPKPKKLTTIPEGYRPNHTYILTFDSLGQRHPQAGRQLSKYLSFEAKDKKNHEVVVDVLTKTVNVPTQPNFCDCGLYLLHLAQTFISDPKNYMEKIFSTKARATNAEKQEIWHDQKVPSMRENMQTRIRELSAEWKKTQTSTKPPPKGEDAETSAPKEPEPSSDSDIEITQHTGPPPKNKGRAPKQTAAKRIR